MRRVLAGSLIACLHLLADTHHLAAAPHGSAISIAPSEGVVRIRDHRGGFLPDIMRHRDRLAGLGMPVRIDGAYCFSSCTVFLSLPDVCVRSFTRFGFHAPTGRDGRRLDAAEFERATRFVADLYTPQLAAWWLETGRHVRNGFAFLTGSELADMGYSLCAGSEGS